MTVSGISALNLVIWLLFGGIIGLTIHLFDPHRVRGGVFSSLFMGMLGAFLGGIIASSIFSQPLISFSLPGFLLAVMGGLFITILARIMLNEGRYTGRKKLRRGLL